MKELRDSLAVVRSAVAKARTVREALARAEAEAEAVAGRIESARRALVTAQADAAVTGAPVVPESVTALRAQLDTAERDAAIRDEVRAELLLRLEAVAPGLEAARSALSRALAAEAESLGGEVVAEVRRFLAPQLRRVAALIDAGGNAPALGEVVGLASMLGLSLERDPASAEGKVGEDVRAASSELTALLSEIAAAAFERHRLAQLAARERGRNAAA